MSMNIYITAVRNVTAKNKKGDIVHDKQVKKFEAIQTPSDVSYQIQDSENPKQTYIDFINNWREYPIYADDDLFGEKEPIGIEQLSWTEEHINQFINWIEEYEEQGYTINYDVM